MKWIKSLSWLLICSSVFALGMALIWFGFGDRFSTYDVIEAGAVFLFVMLAIILIGNWKKS